MLSIYPQTSFLWHKSPQTKWTQHHFLGWFSLVIGSKCKCEHLTHCWSACNVMWPYVFMPLHVMAFVVPSVNCRQKTDHTRRKGMNNYVRKWCVFLSSFLLEVTWVFWKMWTHITAAVDMVCWYQRFLLFQKENRIPDPLPLCLFNHSHHCKMDYI